MLTRNEYLYTKELVKRKEKALSDYMMFNEGFCAWVEFNNLSESDKSHINQEWDGYYAKVKESLPYRSFHLMREVMTANGDKSQLRKLVAEGKEPTVKALAAKATERLIAGNYLPKPTSQHPAYLERFNKAQIEMQAELDTLRKLLLEHKEVYERSNTGDDL